MVDNNDVYVQDMTTPDAPVITLAEILDEQVAQVELQLANLKATTTTTTTEVNDV